MNLQDAIQQVQEVGQQHGFTIVVVGGAFVRLIGKNTIIRKIDESTKTIFVEHAEDPDTVRNDDKKTIVDIDCIAFSNAEDPFTKETKSEFSKLLQELLRLQENKSFPPISLESVLYHPYFPKPNSLIQFVSSIESYHDQDFFFRLGGAKQNVRKSSLSFWRYEFIETKRHIVSFNPLAIQRRYNIRGFLIKPKDKEKIWGEHAALTKFVRDFNKKTKQAYEKDFKEWDEFEAQIASSHVPSMGVKRNLWIFYWQTIGTYLAHGTGIVGKLLLPLGNTFFAGRQKDF